MKKTLILLSLSILGIFSCKTPEVTTDVDKQFDADVVKIKDYVAKQANASSYRALESGVYFLLTKTNANGKALAPGYVATFKYELTLLDGTRIDSATVSTFFDNTAVLKNAKGFTSSIATNVVGITQGIYLSKEGEEGTFILPSSWAYGTSSTEKIPANSVMRLDLKVLKYKDEDTQIDEYIAANKLVLKEKTSTGLRYVVTTASTGNATVSGAVTNVNYEGRTLFNDAKFDSGNFSFNLGKGEVIKGFDEGILKMKVGEKARLIMPPSIAYGSTAQGSGKIPAYSILIFDVDVVK